MASYALLGALSGFRYSAVERCLWFAPRLAAGPFRCFFSAQGAWGTVALDSKRLTIAVEEGELAVSKVVVGSGKQQVTIEQSALVKAGSPLGIPLPGSKGQGERKTKKDERQADRLLRVVKCAK